MSQKRTLYVKTSQGLEKQYIASHGSIVDLDPIDGIEATNVQGAIKEIADVAATGGVTGVKGDAETSYRKGNVNITPTDIGLGNVTNDAQVKRSEMGVSGGVATLGSDGKVPTSQLPSYVDDVLEYPSLSYFPILGETGKVYVASDTNLTYRWSGTSYVEISASLALGETSSTAYAGDKGKQNATDIAGLKVMTQSVATRISNIEAGTTPANKADKLSTERTIEFTGDATGSYTFDGSSDETVNMTLSNTGVPAGTYSVVSTDAKGRITAGSQLIEWGASGQTEPSDSLAVGGIFFELVG